VRRVCNVSVHEEPDTALGALEERIGYRFKNRALLIEALTHASVEAQSGCGRRTYERLEFLGDRVLGVIVAERLFSQFRSADEAELALRYNALVNRGACARAARRAGVGDALIMSGSEAEAGGRTREAMLADACEALIAALHLDGGVELARAFVTTFWADEFDQATSLRKDAKTALQEWAAAQRRALAYIEIARSGPDHAPNFIIEARVDGFGSARGAGASKREAERAAAAALLAAHGADV